MTDEVARVWDTLLPNQRVTSDCYAGKAENYFPALYETLVRASGIRGANEELTLVVPEGFSQETMGCNPIFLRLLQLVLVLLRAQRVLEIGTFVGVSAMYMAEALGESGTVTTVEKFPEFARIAQENFRVNGLADRIALVEGDAIEVIRELPAGSPFDLIFIDGNKERYADYFEVLEPLLRTGGLFVVDDVLFHGDVLNPVPRTEKGRGVRAFLDRAQESRGYLRLALPVGNGVMFLLRQ